MDNSPITLEYSSGPLVVVLVQYWLLKTFSIFFRGSIEIKRLIRKF